MPKKGKKRRILEAYSTCFLCGENPSVEVDHVPARILFKNKVGPEGFEFGACSVCNRSASQLEQLVAFFCRTSDIGEINYDEEEVAKLITAVKNNHKGVIDLLEVNPIEKLSASAKIDQRLSMPLLAGEVSIVRLPRIIRLAIEAVCYRILFALYLKHHNEPIPSHCVMRCVWQRAYDAKATNTWSEISTQVRFPERPKRVNTSIGNQFVYKWDKPNDRDGIFVQVYLSNVLIIYGNVADPRPQQGIPSHVSRAEGVQIARGNQVNDIE